MDHHQYDPIYCGPGCIAGGPTLGQAVCGQPPGRAADRQRESALAQAGQERASAAHLCTCPAVLYIRWPDL